MGEIDIAEPHIEAVRAAGIKAAADAAKTRELQPIIEKVEGNHLVGICHHCESTIPSGHLFCAVDRDDPDSSCSSQWAHERKHRKELGR